MFSSVITANIKNQPLLLELQDGISISPSAKEFKKLKDSSLHIILRNIKDQGMTAFWVTSVKSKNTVSFSIFPENISKQIIQKYQLRTLRAPREVKLHEKMRQKFDSDMEKEQGLCINPAYINLGKLQDKSRASIELNVNVPYIWLYNAQGEVVLGIEHVWDHLKSLEFGEQVSEKVRMLKKAITDNYLVDPIVEEKKAESEIMLSKTGGLGHASLSPIFNERGKVISLEGEAYIAGELFFKKGKWTLTNKSGRFFFREDSLESNERYLKKTAAFMAWRLGKSIEIEVVKNKLDPAFLWNKALNEKKDEFCGDKIKIAFNCVTKVYKHNGYTPEALATLKMVVNEKQRLFDMTFPKTDTVMTTEERFALAIVFIMDYILVCEKNKVIRVSLVEQIKYMIDHQLPDSLPAPRKASLREYLSIRQREVSDVGKDREITVSSVTQEQLKLK